MGKKKSTVLMVLLTIVIVALCAITAFPSFSFGVKNWNPAVMQYDLGADLGGGYYTYYYPTGVISEAEYNGQVADLQAAVDEGEDGAEEELEKYQGSYEQYKKKDANGEYTIPTGLYLNNDSDYGIVDYNEDDNVNAEFREEFNRLASEIAARYAAKGYSDYRVAVVDDFSIRVEIPAAEKTDNLDAFDHASSTFGMLAETEELQVLLGDSVVSDGEEGAAELIKEISLYTQYETVFLRFKFTSAGKEVLDEFAYNLEASENASSSTEAQNLMIKVGDVQIELDSYDYFDGYELKYPVGTTSEKDYAKTWLILFNSALNNGGYDIELNDISNSQVRTYGSVYGEYTLILLYVAIAAVIVGLIVFSILKMGRFGVVSAYSTLSYLIVAGLCFAFIIGGVYEITLGTALVFVLGLVLMNAFNAYVYNAIKSEFAQGKTVESSIKSGYKKTLWNMVDVYAVLLLGALALLIGAAGLGTLATQAIICIVTGAFCNLLWTRVINYVFLSASKNKYKYFRFVREDDDDE